MQKTQWVRHSLSGGQRSNSISTISLMFVAAATLALLTGCQEQSANTAEEPVNQKVTEAVENSNETDNSGIESSPNRKRLAMLTQDELVEAGAQSLAKGDFEEAATAIVLIYERLGESDTGKLVSKLRSGEASLENRRLAVALSEHTVAESGNRSAAYIAGTAYKSGTVVEKDLEKAVGYFSGEKAATYAPSVYHHGMILLDPDYANANRELPLR